jgi:hypothetical protein
VSTLQSAASIFGTLIVSPRSTVNFQGVIPGGTSFSIPQGPPSSNPTTGTGFPWQVDISGGTNILVVASDDRGIGSGGSAPFTVAYASNSSCLNSNSPSSTAGNPAGGSYPTSISDTSSGNGGTSYVIVFFLSHAASADTISAFEATPEVSLVCNFTDSRSFHLIDRLLSQVES